MIESSEGWQSSRDSNLKNPLESHFSFNKKCFVSHTILIQSALHLSDPVECFTYSESPNICVRHIENFLRGSEVKFFTKNSHRMIEDSGTCQSFRDLHFKNPLENHFSFNKKCLVSRTVLIQCALHFSNLEECFTCSSM